MYDSYKLITNPTVTITDTNINRNSLGYMVLDNQQSVGIPIVTKLYDYQKYVEIIDTIFTELFPNDVQPLSTVDLESQLAILQSQLSGSNQENSTLQSIIDGLLQPGGEPEMWRTRKTFKRVVDSNKGTYTLGFPIINTWSDTKWGQHAGAVMQVLGPTVSDAEQVLINEFYSMVQGFTTYLNNNPNDITNLEVATFLNESEIPGYVINIPGSGAPYAPSAITNPIIFRLQNSPAVPNVLEQEINILSMSDLPYCYRTINPDTQLPWIQNIQQFRALCKKIVYWVRVLSSNNVVTNNINLRLHPPSSPAVDITTQFSTISEYENNPVYNITNKETYYLDIP